MVRGPIGYDLARIKNRGTCAIILLVVIIILLGVGVGIYTASSDPVCCEIPTQNETICEETIVYRNETVCCDVQVPQNVPAYVCKLNECGGKLLIEQWAGQLEAGEATSVHPITGHVLRVNGMPDNDGVDLYGYDPISTVMTQLLSPLVGITNMDAEIQSFVWWPEQEVWLIVDHEGNIYNATLDFSTITLVAQNDIVGLRALVIVPDGRIFATSSADGLLYLIDPNDFSTSVGFKPMMTIPSNTLPLLTHHVVYNQFDDNVYISFRQMTGPVVVNPVGVLNVDNGLIELTCVGGPCIEYEEPCTPTSWEDEAVSIAVGLDGKMYFSPKQGAPNENQLWVLRGPPCLA